MILGIEVEHNLIANFSRLGRRRSGWHNLACVTSLAVQVSRTHDFFGDELYLHIFRNLPCKLRVYSSVPQVLRSPLRPSHHGLQRRQRGLQQPGWGRSYWTSASSRTMLRMGKNEEEEKVVKNGRRKEDVRSLCHPPAFCTKESNNGTRLCLATEKIPLAWDTHRIVVVHAFIQ